MAADESGSRPADPLLDAPDLHDIVGAPLGSLLTRRYPVDGGPLRTIGEGARRAMLDLALPALGVGGAIRDLPTPKLPAMEGRAEAAPRPAAPPADPKKGKPAKPVDLAEEIQQKLDALGQQASRKPGEAEPAIPSDPYAQLMERARATVPAWVPAPLRALGRTVIPQTMPGLVGDATMLALTGGAGPAASFMERLGATGLRDMAAWLGKRELAPAVARILTTGTAAGTAAGATGYSPSGAFAAGTAGATLGELGGGGADIWLQRSTVNRMKDQVTERLAERFRRILPPGTLPKEPEAVMTTIISNRVGDAIDGQIGDLFQTYGKTVLTDSAVPQWVILPLERRGVKITPSGPRLPNGARSVQFEDIWTPLQTAKGRAPAGSRLAHELQELEGRTLTALAQDEPGAILKYRGLVNARDTANRLSAFMQGNQGPEAAGEALLDSQGRISIDGWRALVRRLAFDSSRWEKELGPVNVESLADGLGWVAARGAARPESGTGFSPWASMHGGSLFPRIGIHLPRSPWAPGWQDSATLRRLATTALPALSPGLFQGYVPRREE